MSNELIPQKNSIFDKIIIFFKKLLKKEYQNDVSDDIPEENYSFITYLKDKDVEGIKAIYELKECFELGEVKEENLTSDEYETLHMLYDIEIKSLNENIDNKRQQLENLKKKIILVKSES